MDILFSLSILLLVLTSSVWCRNCRVESFKQHVQENFDPVKFQGRWYAMMTNQYWIRSYFVPKNVQFEFNALQDGRLSIQASASFFGSYCDFVSGSGRIIDKEDPAVFLASFDTNYSLANKMNTYWVLSTDYNRLAVLYTCWKTREDGTCDPSEAYIWTLTRTLTEHSIDDLAEINNVVQLVCMPEDNFLTFGQDGGCDFNPFNFPNTYGVVFIVSTLFIGFLILSASFGYLWTKYSDNDGVRKRGNVLIFN